ncbi:MAG TPA: spore maturation protein [Desulfurivibrio alkaliphilus]|uniref:Spore maturation protein n=1 Tax=Desulfurivibrio alkaliphilus TaxID=427923 RepID=A0A7C2TIB8_9BACT|nr:spore maturation protein [Desulfurivibrio alkaliphilus]
MQPKTSVINIIWLGLIGVATVTAAYTGRMDEVTRASFESAKAGVMLAIGLIGPMALWLGIMKVAEAGGLMRMIARGLRPVMTRLFPEVPAEHPAMSAMIMNMAANTLGLGNAATPMGIKAMQELDKLAAEKGTATNAMCLFLAINTSSVTLLPLGVITVRAAAGATSPAEILIPAIVATCCSTIVAITAAKLLAGPEPGPPPAGSAPQSEPGPAAAVSPDPPELAPPGRAGLLFVILLLLAFAGGLFYRLFFAAAGGDDAISGLTAASSWLIPMLIAGLLIFGYLRGVRVYEVATEGAKEGFTTAVRIIPFLVAIFVAIGMFRASGAMEIMVNLLSPLTQMVGMPAEALGMALMRPLSGSGAFGMMSEIVAADPDSFLAFLVSVMQGSTETTFYVLAVYFGAVGITRARHALPAALLADGAGIVAAVAICNFWF